MSNRLGVPVKFKKMHHLAKVPTYAKPGDSGADLSWADDESGTMLWAGETKTFWTGLAIQLPDEWEAQIRPRSSLSAKGVVCAFGTIDSGYRGQLGIVLTNTTNEPISIVRGQRIAQIVICPVARAQFSEVDELTDSERGDGGFGSSGSMH
jgi:dUTP pyrophosphatase